MATPNSQNPAKGEGHSSNQSESCVRRILELVHARKLKPGERLGEGTLAKMLGVGRAPIKMALSELAYAGVVERRHRSGSYVPQWSIDDFVHLLQLRTALECMACEQAARVACDSALDGLLEDAEQLDALDQLFRSGKIHVEEVYARDMAFHASIARMSGNPWLLRALDDHHVLAGCMRAWIDRPDEARNWTLLNPLSHVLLAKNLRTRNPELASQSMRIHLLSRIPPSMLRANPPTSR